MSVVMVEKGQNVESIRSRAYNMQMDFSLQKLSKFYKFKKGAF